MSGAIAHSPADGYLEAIERIRGEMGDLPLEAFENDWRRQWLVERGIEIVSESSRHLTDEMKTRHPEIPWKKVAGIGNVLRHNYETVAAPVMWKLARVRFESLARCHVEAKVSCSGVR